MYAEAFQLNVIAYEYPGYGVYPGKPTASGVRKDIKYVYRFLTEFLKVPPNNIIIFGRSIGSLPLNPNLCLGVTLTLGTGPSVYLANRIEKKNPKSLGGLILQRFPLLKLSLHLLCPHTP